MDWKLDDGLRALKMMQRRTSTRSFSDEQISDELMDEILKAALQAPSGGNLQPISVVKITDEVKRNKIMEMCGNQKFIGEAPVNLLFFVDFHKKAVFAKHEKAPYTCPNSYMHFLIAVEDVMCMAQIVESAAHLVGLGSCYVGTVNNLGDEISELFGMPEGTYPIVMLSLGYPKGGLAPIREKLSREIMIFDEMYPKFSDDEIVAEYRKKYQDRSMPFPNIEEKKSEMLETFKEALLTSYPADEVDEIVAVAAKENKLNETQRRFGLHYHAAGLREIGKVIIGRMEKMGIRPFER